MAEKYPWLSPYLYCANNPVNAFDPDGSITIVINGMHFGDGGKSQYWNGIDKIAMDALNDYNVAYVDGACGGVCNTLTSGILNSNISADNRIRFGYIWGTLEAKNIYEKLINNETIKIITHSMGSAYAKGFVKALMEYAQKQGIDPRIIFELDLAPFEWWNQAGVTGVPTFTISYWLDGLAWPDFMKNAENYRTRLLVMPDNPLSEHSIESFSQEFKDVLDGIIQGINKGEIKFYIDGRRIN